MRRIWFERRFSLGLTPGAFPDILERLRGTPLRLEERTAGVPDSALRLRAGGRWSIQEHAGHLLDLEVLWHGRLDDFAAGLPGLRPADLENRATWDADHNTSALGNILRDFRAERGRFIARLETLSEEERMSTAGHPRLEQPMSVVDLCFFVAEHDDHHLAAITELRST